MDDKNFGQATGEGSKHLTGVQRRLLAKQKKDKWKKAALESGDTPGVHQESHNNASSSSNNASGAGSRKSALGEGYVDRAEERRKQLQKREDEEAKIQKVSVKESLFMGGTMDTTHMVKGLDRGLLKKKQEELAKVKKEEEHVKRKEELVQRQKKKSQVAISIETDVCNSLHPDNHGFKHHLQQMHKKLQKGNRVQKGPQKFLPGRHYYQFGTRMTDFVEHPINGTRPRDECKPVEVDKKGEYCDSRMIKHIVAVFDHIKLERKLKKEALLQKKQQLADAAETRSMASLKSSGSIGSSIGLKKIREKRLQAASQFFDGHDIGADIPERSHKDGFLIVTKSSGKTGDELISGKFTDAGLERSKLGSGGGTTSGLASVQSRNKSLDIFADAGVFDAASFAKELKEKAAASLKEKASGGIRSFNSATSKSYTGSIRTPSDTPAGSDARSEAGTDARSDAGSSAGGFFDSTADDDFLSNDDGDYQPSDRWRGAKKGWVFKTGDKGLGYYRDYYALVQAEKEDYLAGRRTKRTQKNRNNVASSLSDESDAYAQFTPNAELFVHTKETREHDAKEEEKIMNMPKAKREKYLGRMKEFDGDGARDMDDVIKRKGIDEAKELLNEGGSVPGRGAGGKMSKKQMKIERLKMMKKSASDAKAEDAFLDRELAKIEKFDRKRKFGDLENLTGDDMRTGGGKRRKFEDGE